MPPQAIGRVEHERVYDARDGECPPGHGAESDQKVRERSLLRRNDLNHEGRDLIHEKHPFFFSGAWWGKVQRTSIAAGYGEGGGGKNGAEKFNF